MGTAEWRSRALCAGGDPTWWDVDVGYEFHVRAVAICGDCPVRAECYAHAENDRSTIRSKNPEGVYGGMIWTGNTARPQRVENYHKVPRPCGYEKCDVVFTPRVDNGKHIYCSENCRATAQYIKERAAARARTAERRRRREAIKNGEVAAA